MGAPWLFGINAGCKVYSALNTATPVAYLSLACLGVGPQNCFPKSRSWRGCSITSQMSAFPHSLQHQRLSPSFQDLFVYRGLNCPIARLRAGTVNKHLPVVSLLCPLLTGAASTVGGRSEI